MSASCLSSPFDPAADPFAFRDALSRFATGVTVVTTVDQDGALGITANSFASLSLVPPLVLWAPAKASRRHDAFVRAPQYVIHVLAADQSSLCDHFARSAGGFASLPHDLSEHGIPILRGCAATFECTLCATHDGGDHTIIIGRVHKAQANPGATLLFHYGQMVTSAFESRSHAGKG